MNTTTTMSANQNLLRQFAQPLVAPGAKPARPALRRTMEKSESAEPALWRVTLAAAHPSLAETALFAALATASAAGVAWLALTTWHFCLSWEGFVAWVRAALM